MWPNTGAWRGLMAPVRQKKAVRRPSASPEAWNTKSHMVPRMLERPQRSAYPSGQAHDAPEGRRLLESLGATSRPVHLHIDRAYEGNETRQLDLDRGFMPVVPSMKTRIEPWEYDR